MGLIKFIITSILIFISGLILLGCLDSTSTYSNVGKIEGSVMLIGVIDGNYSNVMVCLNSTVIASTITTNQDGKFTFSDLPDGTYSISCAKNTYTTANVSNVKIYKSNEIELGNVILAPSAPPGEPNVN